MCMVSSAIPDTFLCRVIFVSDPTPISIINQHHFDTSATCRRHSQLRKLSFSSSHVLLVGCCLDFCCRCCPWRTCRCFALSKGLVIAVAFGKVALLGVLLIIVVVEGLVIIATLGVLVIIVTLSILVIVVAPGVLVFVFALGILVSVTALGLLVINVVGKGLVFIVGCNGRVVVLVPIGERLVVAVIANGLLAVVVGDVALLGILRWVMFWSA
jgi:hypothetical protein